MKDVVIKGSTVKKECFIWLSLFVFAFFMNVYAIVVHDGAWPELFTQLHIVLVLSVVFYLLLALVRMVVYGVKKLF